MTPLRPHHDGSPLHVAHAEPRVGDLVTVRVRVPQDYARVARVWVRSNPDHEAAWVEAVCDGDADGWQWWSAAIRVTNPRHGYRFHLVLEDGRVEVLGQGGLSDIDGLDGQDFALVAGNPPPTWMDDTVLYQIFPDRFARSAQADQREAPSWAIPARWDEPLEPVSPGRGRQFYGGDLDGAAEKLDHLVDLGITALYHTPVFPAESNHRYDAARFDAVDPLLGGDDAYLRLIEAAHARGIRVIGDLTTNHSGSAHEWFRAAFGHPGAPEADFYYFTNAEHTSYVSWLDVESLPKLDWKSPELRRRFIEGADSVVGRWLRPPFAIDGWRIDVANMTGRLGEEDLNAEVRRTLRQTMVDIAPDTLLLAESTHDAASDLQGDAWHGGMTYPAFTRGVWSWLCDRRAISHYGFDGELTDDMWFFGLPTGMPRYSARQFVAQYERFTSQIPWRVQRGTMAALDTHDTARFTTYAAPGAVPVALGLSVTLPGIPVVYAGDEFGLDGLDGEMSRTPIPWDRADEPEIAARIALYRDLLHLRRAHPVLGAGGLRWLHVEDAGVVFVRESAEECVLVVATRGGLDATLPPSAASGAGAATRLFGDGELTVAPDGSTRVQAAGTSFTAWALPGVRAPRSPEAPAADAIPEAFAQLGGPPA